MNVVRSLVVFTLTILTSIGAAQAQPTPDRPLVFVPGILGSRLCDGDNNVVWGTTTSLKHFARLELDTEPPAKLHPCGLVDEIQIFGSLWTHNTYKSWLKGLADIGYSAEHRNLFLFDYDWRLSNFENAKQLDSFVAENIEPGKSFDVIAHSMGGIVLRIYLDEYVSAKSVRQVFYVGTPFLGSMNTFGTIKEGWGWPFTNLAGGQDVITRVALSFPSMLEMLPRYDECCYIRKTDNSRQYLNIFDPQTWRSLHWLPSSYTDDTKFARFSERLQTFRKLDSVACRTSPTKRVRNNFRERQLRHTSPFRDERRCD